MAVIGPSPTNGGFVEVRMAVDVERLPEYRRLLAAGWSAAQASHFWLRLWVELGYAADGTEPTLGRLTVESADLLRRGLESEGYPGDVIEVGVAAGLLLPHSGGGWYCRRFAMVNEQLNGSRRSMQMMGADRSAFVRRQRRVEQEAEQQALMLPAQAFTDPDGQPMDAETTRRVMIVIQTVDNALFRPRRMHWGEGLIHDAWRCLRDSTMESMTAAAETVVRNRKHPLLAGLTTEKALPIFRHLAMQLAQEA